MLLPGRSTALVLVALPRMGRGAMAPSLRSKSVCSARFCVDASDGSTRLAMSGVRSRVFLPCRPTRTRSLQDGWFGACGPDGWLHESYTGSTQVSAQNPDLHALSVAYFSGAPSRSVTGGSVPWRRRACGWLVGAINYGAIGRVEQGARVWLGLSPRILFAIWRGLCSRASRTTLTPSPPRACRVRRRRVTAFNACRESRPLPSLRVRGPGLPRRQRSSPVRKIPP